MVETALNNNGLIDPANNLPSPSPETIYYTTKPSQNLQVLETIQNISGEFKEIIQEELTNNNNNAKFSNLTIGNEIEFYYYSPYNNTYQIVQIKNSIFNNNNPDITINYVDQILYDFSLNITPLYNSTYNNSGHFQLNLSFNYITSTYYNTLLNVGLYYRRKILSSLNDEIQLDNYILGSENTNFIKGQFYKNILINDISYNKGDNINFYLKAKIATDSTPDITSNYRPKIITTQLGNSFNVSEYIKLVVQ
tara:strand:- start:1836 stop:2588 length:753 start_codon:yes stop_codon:yes gene_type:complete